MTRLNVTSTRQLGEEIKFEMKSIHWLSGIHAKAEKKSPYGCIAVRACLCVRACVCAPFLSVSDMTGKRDAAPACDGEPDV